MVVRRISQFPLLILFLAVLSFGASAEAEDQQLTVASSPTYIETMRLSPFEATYRATINKGVSIDGSATISLIPQKNGDWLYLFKVKSFIADINESLLFHWENNEVIPVRYRYKLAGMLIKNRENSLDFNWDKKTATGRFRGKPASLPLEAGILDPLGYQVQLGQDIRAGKTDMSYKVANRTGYDTDRFAVIGEETIDTKLGALRTIKVEKVRGEGRKRETLMWFAPEQNYLLVRLMQQEPDGTRYEIHINDVDTK